jgi:hypothetical protein
LSKERRFPLLGSPAIAVILAIILAAFGLREASPVNALVFAVAIVDPSDDGFDDGDFDLSDAQIFPLNTSDGVVGNSGLVFDTFFAGVGETVWIGISVEEGGGELTIDSNDYGTFTEVLCNDTDNDGDDFERPDDSCVSTEGLGTDRLIVDDDENVLDHQPPGPTPRMGVGVAFECEDGPGIAEVHIGQDGDSFDFFIVCHGQLATAVLSATATRLEVDPQLGSTAHSLIRLQLFDQFGGIVAGYEVDWFVDRCGIETSDVDGVADEPGEVALQEVLEILSGQVQPEETVGPDAESPQHDAARNVVFDFNGDGVLEAISLAVIHCEPGHSPTSPSPGPINIRARVNRAGEPPRDFFLTINLIGPPAKIFLTASPTNVRCGEKIVVTATVVDILNQPVSDNTPIEFVTNFGGTGTAGALRGVVAPLMSTVSRTLNGQATFFLLTSNFNVGRYDVVAEVDGIFSTPPVNAFVSVSCFLPPTPGPAATVVAPSTGTGVQAAPAVTVRPPSTGDAGLR